MHPDGSGYEGEWSGGAKQGQGQADTLARLLHYRYITVTLSLDCLGEAATPCNGGCNPVQRRLQPRVVGAATLCDGGCDPTSSRL